MNIKVALVTSVLFLTACAGTVERTLQEKNQGFRDYLSQNNIENVEKITSFRLHGWNSLTDDFLILSTSPRKKYLIELNGYCGEIRWAHTIRVNRTTGSTLHARTDSISALESPQIKCRIKSIYPLSKAQVKDIVAIDDPKSKRDNEVKHYNKGAQGIVSSSM